MQIKVKYFASLRDHLGRVEDVMELEEGMNVKTLWEKIIGETSAPEDIITAINMEYVQNDTVIQEGDEVAFFPPVTGG